MEIEREEMSLQEMIANMKKRLRQEKKIDVLEIFRRMKTRTELVISFIAILEIVRTESVRLMQKDIFGDIILETV